MQVLDAYHRGPKEIALVGPVAGEDGRQWLEKVHGVYIPHRIISGFDPEQGGPRPPLLQGRDPVQGRLTVYVCEDFSCSAPVTTWEDLQPLLTDRGQGR